MRVEVVPYYVDLAARTPTGEFLHERHGLRGSPAFEKPPEDLAGVDLESSEETPRAEPLVLELAARHLSRNTGPARMDAPKHLHARLLVHADHRGTRARLQVEVANLGDLPLEVGVGTVQLHPVVMGAQVGLVQDSPHGRGAQVRDLGLHDGLLQSRHGPFGPRRWRFRSRCPARCLGQPIEFLHQALTLARLDLQAVDDLGQSSARLFDLAPRAPLT